MDRWTGVVGACVVVAGVTVGCGGGNGEGVEGVEGGGGVVTDVAREVFVECAESRGAGIRELVIGREGVETLLYTSETPAELYDPVARACERAAMEAVGASDADDGGEALPPVPQGVVTVDGYLAHLGEAGFNGAVLVADGDDVVAEGGFGEADREEQQPVTVDTAFDVGSVAKVFTAVAVLRAVDEGATSLQTPLSAVFPDVPADKAQITVLQLLAHRSGLGEHHDTEGDFEAMSRREALERIFAQELAFEPGAAVAYSNSGYTLLAALLEEVQGRPFEEVLAGLFDLAGMAETGVYGSDALQDVSVATGYGALRFAANSPATWSSVSWALMGSGGVAASVSDLHRWIVAVHDGTLLGDEMRTVLYDDVLATPQIIPQVPVAGYAGANDFGFDVAVVELLDEDQHVIVATNVAGGDGPSPDEAAVVLARLLADGGTS